jgi:hypothetical protein
MKSTGDRENAAQASPAPFCGPSAPALDIPQAIALKLAQEWQAVIATLLADAILNAAAFPAGATIELKGDMHPYFAGKLALLRYMKELADADVERFQDDEAAGLLSLLTAAHAWAGAIERCDGVVAAEQVLLEAIKAL